VSFLPEYALLPEVLEATGDDSRESLRSVFELFLREGIVRNLHKGRWCRHLTERQKMLSHGGQKVFKFLVESGRLVSCPEGLPKPPEASEDWCREAIASRRHRDLRAVFAEKTTASQFTEEPIVVVLDEAIERNDLRPAKSIKLRFHVDDYRRHLAPLMQVAREVCFIDPYIHPGHAHYRKGFLEIIKLAASNPYRPRIEIHRMSEVGYKQELCSEREWKPIFADWHRQLAAMRLGAEVLIWSKFASRYFLTNHVGLNAGKGFKSDPSKEEPHYWTPLERTHRDHVRGEFNSLGNSSVKGRVRKCQFSIGAS